MKDTKNISEILKGYTFEELAQMKLDEIAEQKRELERQEQQARAFLEGRKLTPSVKPTSVKATVYKDTSERTDSRQGQIRAVTKGKYLTIEQIVRALDWGKDAELPFQKKKSKVHSAVKQMMRHGKMTSRDGANGYKEYGS